MKNNPQIIGESSLQIILRTAGENAERRLVNGFVPTVSDRIVLGFSGLALPEVIQYLRRWADAKPRPDAPRTLAVLRSEIAAEWLRAKL